MKLERSGNDWPGGKPPSQLSQSRKSRSRSRSRRLRIDRSLQRMPERFMCWWIEHWSVDETESVWHRMAVLVQTPLLGLPRQLQPVRMIRDLLPSVETLRGNGTQTSDHSGETIESGNISVFSKKSYLTMLYAAASLGSRNSHLLPAHDLGALSTYRLET